ncbi:winged helix-turn-helix domain-containing protein [Frankia sp. CNm7]|uniref:Winged helix-turn-helix domain-containing protein n=1 Tax=Frankia nepalensis TaxID=1836974 RepID=A0A937UP96_9ACTN|nr:MarR family transcriptional regulator [Frankia nepalensis]MBL7495525.1 winged helix-turn-helix domain-containing protein [Frankia nepalensis]MBL7509806.1 winged helix-turn-helix domain-containing protein [Frankia nepalensis]MBL7518619.1 winged helix-turn-helix domain-containing protein [Frankia nepalensis]MBL7630629.1 winged helix-turn-helix domain-containing protein [Frankia nepalensis]
MATVADRILGHLAGVPAGLDDGRLAEAIGASRSSVNNACRKLAEQGRLVRAVGADGKILNMVGSGSAPAEGGSVAAAEPATPEPELPVASVAEPADEPAVVPEIPAARSGPDDVPGIPAARLPGDDEIAAAAEPVAEPEPVVAEAEPEPVEPVEPEAEPEPVVAEAEPEPVAEAEPVAAEPEPEAEAVVEPEPAGAVADGEVTDAEVTDAEVAEGELVEPAPAAAEAADDSDIVDAETSAEPDPSASPSGPRRPWWRRLLPLR